MDLLALGDGATCAMAHSAGASLAFPRAARLHVSDAPRATCPRRPLDHAARPQHRRGARYRRRHLWPDRAQLAERHSPHPHSTGVRRHQRQLMYPSASSDIADALTMLGLFQLIDAGLVDLFRSLV